VKPSLRKILGDSHIAAVAIAILVTWSLEWILDALQNPFFRVASFVMNAIAILGFPYGASDFSLADRNTLFVSLSFCFYALTAVVAAWILSRWVYGGTPIGTLREYHARIVRRGDV
jgi:hypothetical protein